LESENARAGAQKIMRTSDVLEGSRSCVYEEICLLGYIAVKSVRDHSSKQSYRLRKRKNIMKLKNRTGPNKEL
jgi:hypothetical protein